MKSQAKSLWPVLNLTPFLGESGEPPARRIAILAGAGVEHDDAADRLRSLAQRFAVPVTTTLRPKGVLAEDHPLSLGVFGYTHRTRISCIY